MATVPNLYEAELALEMHDLRRRVDDCEYEVEELRNDLDDLECQLASLREDFRKRVGSCGPERRRVTSPALEDERSLPGRRTVPAHARSSSAARGRRGGVAGTGKAPPPTGRPRSKQ